MPRFRDRKGIQMHKGYEPYCSADPQVHDATTIATVQDGPPTIGRHQPACGWRTTRMGDRPVLTPGGAACRHGAGAIHASACPYDAGRIVKTIRACTRPIDEQRFERIHRARSPPRRR
jgi:hypothetical protein